MPERPLASGIVALVAVISLVADGHVSARQIPLRSSGGPTTSATAERLTQYQAGVAEAVPITRDVL